MEGWIFKLYSKNNCGLRPYSLDRDVLDQAEYLPKVTPYDVLDLCDKRGDLEEVA